MVYSYPHNSGLTNRANSALLRIERILEQREIPSAVRLVLIAEIMASEPVLECTSGAAFGARRDTAAHKNRAQLRLSNPGKHAPVAEFAHGA